MREQTRNTKFVTDDSPTNKQIDSQFAQIFTQNENETAIRPTPF